MIRKSGNRFSEKDHAQMDGEKTMTASIVGWAHTPFGKFDTETVESLGVKVANEALAGAGVCGRASGQPGDCLRGSQNRAGGRRRANDANPSRRDRPQSAARVVSA